MKKFLILGNMNACTYKEVFPYIKCGQLWLGVHANKTMKYKLSDDYEKWNETDENGNKYGKVPSISWFTNIKSDYIREPLELTKKYDPVKYQKYDNYDAIEVSRVADIPVDYYGVMGVPITFLDKWCPDKFEIVGHEHDLDGAGTSLGQFEVNRKGVYKRLLIRRKDRLEPADFEILGWTRHNDEDMDGGYWKGGKADATIDGKEVYRRILIKRKPEQQ